MADRYSDAPFLRFVDAWVLKAIGHLDKATEEYCVAMVPHLERSFGLRGSWDEIVAQRMDFDAGLAARIQAIWTEGKARFEEANGRPAEPVQFAMIFVDRNFGREGGNREWTI